MHFRHYPLIHFGPHLLQVMERAPHFLLRLGSAILQPAVLQATVKAGSLAVSLCPVTEKGSRWVAAAAFFVAHSSLEPGLFACLPFDLCRYVICPATVELVIAAVDLFSLPAPDFVVVGSVAVVAGLAVAADSAATVAAVDPAFVAAADLVCFVDSVCSVCPFVAGMAMGKGRAVVAISCLLTPRSSS